MRFLHVFQEDPGRDLTEKSEWKEDRRVADDGDAPECGMTDDLFWIVQEAVDASILESFLVADLFDKEISIEPAEISQDVVDGDGCREMESDQEL